MALWRVPFGSVGVTATADGYACFQHAMLLGATAENIVHNEVLVSGTAKNFRMNITVNGAAATINVYLRINGSNTALTLAIGAGSTGTFEDTTNSVSISAGDDCSVFMDRSEAGSITGTSWMIDFMCATPTNVIGSSSTTTSNITNASSTRYWPLSGTRAPSTTEAPAQSVVPCGATLSKIGLHITANARTTTTTFRSRINSANGNQSFTVTAGQTGFFSDSSNSDTVAAGDLINMSSSTSTGTETLTVGSFYALLTGTGTGSVPCVCSSYTPTNNATRYLALLGTVSGPQATESVRQQILRGSGTLQKWYANVSVNSGNNTCSVTVRKNAADTSLTFTIGTATTGSFTDTSNTATYVNGDLINIKTVSAITSGTLTIQNHSIELLPADEGSSATYTPYYSLLLQTSGSGMNV